MRGISLEEIAQHTKISTRMLEAIENDRFDLLPGGIFSRAFVMHYARYLGLNEEGAGAEFDLAVGTPEPVRIEEVAAQRQHLARRRSLAEAGPRRRLLVTLVVAVMLVLCGIAARDWWGPLLDGYRAPAVSPPSPLPPPPPPRLPADAQGAPQPRAAGQVPAPAQREAGRPSAMVAGGKATVPAPALSASTALRLQIDTIDTSSLVIIVDGKTAFRGTMRKGQMRAISADSRIEVKAGNAGAVVLTLNGETQPPLGLMGEVKTAVFTREDLKKP